MAGVKTFEDLAVWQKARALTQLIYQVTSSKAWYSDYSLRDQIRLAVVSVMSNIAEGFERRGDTEFGRFLSIAKGSAGEVRSQLYVAMDMKYINESTYTKANALAIEVSRMISGLSTYLKDSKRSTQTEGAMQASPSL